MEDQSACHCPRLVVGLAGIVVFIKLANRARRPPANKVEVVPLRRILGREEESLPPLIAWWRNSGRRRRRHNTTETLPRLHRNASYPAASFISDAVALRDGVSSFPFSFLATPPQVASNSLRRWSHSLRSTSCHPFQENKPKNKPIYRRTDNQTHRVHSAATDLD